MVVCVSWCWVAAHVASPAHASKCLKSSQRLFLLFPGSPSCMFRITNLNQDRIRRKPCQINSWHTGRQFPHIPNEVGDQSWVVGQGSVLQRRSEQCPFGQHFARGKAWVALPISGWCWGWTLQAAARTCSLVGCSLETHLGFLDARILLALN